MTEQGDKMIRPTDPVGRTIGRIARVLAIFGGFLSCAMAVIVTVSVAGRYLFRSPIPGDYDIVGILCGCAIFAFLPYCQLNRGNVLVDFFTTKASPRFKAALDAAGAFLYLAAALMFTWRMSYGALEMRQSSEQIAAFSFYRWWTIPFDIFCMVILVCAIAYTLARDVAAARTGGPIESAGRRESATP
jgi:TRAP-type C4-dicarboxylate transport system permease small subunit